jgi:5-methyltetrahydrofolate--homocysteine methyltransferase
MLKDIIENKLVEGRAIVGFYPANTVNDDDVQLFSEGGTEIAKLHMLRQ